jgi:cell division protein FtsB
MIKAAIFKMDNVNKKRIFWTFVSVIALLSGLYIYFVTQTIINTTAYKGIERDIVALDSSISELESEYISLKKEVNLDLTKKLGYVEASDIKFIDKKIVNQTLSLVGAIQ